MRFLMEFRNSRNLSRPDMASILGISQSLYEKVEYNDREPSRNFMGRFKAAFPDFDMNIFFEELIHDTCGCGLKKKHHKEKKDEKAKQCSLNAT